VVSIEALLLEHPFFAGLAREDVALLAGCGVNVRHDAGAYLFHEGDPADRFFVLRRGAVALEVHAPGAGAIIIETRGAGDVLGFSWLFAPHRVRFDARVVEDVSATSFDGTCLRRHCDDDPRLGYDLMKRFSSLLLERLQSTRLQLLDVYGDRGS